MYKIEPYLSLVVLAFVCLSNSNAQPPPALQSKVLIWGNCFGVVPPVLINDSGVYCPPMPYDASSRFGIFPAATKKIQSLKHGTLFFFQNDTIAYLGSNFNSRFGLLETGSDPLVYPAFANFSVTKLAGETLSNVFAGYSTTSVITNSSNLLSWGNGTDGQLGIGTTLFSESPTKAALIQPFLDDIGADPDDVNIYCSTGCIMVYNGDYVVGWGNRVGLGVGSGIGKPSNDYGPFNPPVPIVKISEISMTLQYTLILLANGTILSAGKLQSSPLGRNATDDDHYYFRPINSSLTNSGRFVSVSAGNRHALALAENGIVYAWGKNALSSFSNKYFTLGNPEFEDEFLDFAIPVQMSKAGDLTIKSIRAIEWTSFALTEEGAVLAWGRYVGLQPNMESIQELPQRYVPTLNYFIESLYPTTADASHVIASGVLCRGSIPTPYTDWFCNSDGFYSLNTEGKGPLSLDKGVSLDIPVSVRVQGSFVVAEATTVKFTEAESFINSTGCTFIRGLLILNLTRSETLLVLNGSRTSRELVSTPPSCPPANETIASLIVVSNSDDTCSKLTASVVRTESEQRTIYSTLFKVDSSGCKSSNSVKWWKPTVGAVAGVVVVSAALAATYSYFQHMKFQKSGVAR